MKKWIALAAVAIVLPGGAYFGLPYVAAKNLKDSAIEGDADSLEAAVDFPSVRDSLKSDERRHRKEDAE